jgi:hypothetical protein
MLVGKSWQQTERQVCMCVCVCVCVFVCVYIYICCGDRMYLLRIYHGYIYRQMAENGWSSSLVVGRRSKKYSPYKLTMLRNISKGLGQF